jgi:ribonuclease D
MNAALPATREPIPPLITDSATLADVCGRMAGKPFVTVDTEFLRETTFWPQLCVVQLASDDEAVAIDALAPGLDLQPFLDLMVAPDVVKVFHAARQDIEIIWKLSGRTPAPLFDTQVAAMVCGYGDQVSYEQLAASVVGARIDKSSRFTDWSKRPLSGAQIVYAIADVTHLRGIYTRLLQQLKRTNRLDWLDEELAILTAPETYEQKPENAWMRLRGKARKPRDLSIIMELSEWREREAQSRDVPRSRVLKDDAIVDLALAAPADMTELARSRALPNGYERSRAGAEILAAIERGLARDPETLPPIEKPKPLSQQASAAVQLFKVLLQAVSERHKVAGKLIASTEDLEAIAQDDHADVRTLKGWRRELFGETALALKQGRLALLMERGRVVARTVQPAAAAAD